MAMKHLISLNLTIRDQYKVFVLESTETISKESFTWLEMVECLCMKTFMKN